MAQRPAEDVVTLRPALASELELLMSIDDDASTLYAVHGMTIEVGPGHPFVLAERKRWLESAEQGRTFLAVGGNGMGLGFAALAEVDGAPYLDQLAVRLSAMRQGIGQRLLAHAAEWARTCNGAALWLTTYDHLPFNRPYYERQGYLLVPERECGPGIVHHLEEQRHHLPAPERRVAMRRPL
jgi:GNAT superfamily N-acetyltransferase